MKFKTFYSGSLDEAKKTLTKYEKDYKKAYAKVDKSGSGIEVAQRVFKILMDMGWTKEEIHQFK